MFGVSLSGDRELDRKLKALGPKVASQVIGSATAFAARRQRKLQRAAAKRFRRTGNLQKSIGTRRKTYRRSGTSVAVVGPRMGFTVLPVDDAGKPAGTEPQEAAKYAIGIERGWRGRTPIPFMRQAFESNKRHVLPDFQRGIGRRIEQLAAKK